VQTFFRTSGLQRYFVVRAADSRNAPAVSREVADVVKERLAEWQLTQRAHEETAQVKDAQVAKTDKRGWFKRTGWLEHFANRNLMHLAHPTRLPDRGEVLAEERKLLEPVKPVITRWNSYYVCFERDVKLQSAINAYALHHIRRMRDKDTWAESRGNKQPVAQSWVRSDGLEAADWAVITEYMDVLKPLKTATERLKGRGKSGGFGSIAEVIPVFEYLLSYYEQRVNSYAAVDYNAHPEAPEDHLATNLRAAWAKADNYYSKLDDSPAYYAATILHPY
jgi:hypothetical protein